MRNSVPIFWCLSVEAQAVLMKFQFDNYGVRLDILPAPEGIQIDTELETPEEIDKLMRQPPKHPRQDA